MKSLHMPQLVNFKPITGIRGHPSPPYHVFTREVKGIQERSWYNLGENSLPREKTKMA